MNACTYAMLGLKTIGVVISLASQLVCKAKNKIFGVVNDKKACREGIFVLLVTQRYTERMFQSELTKQLSTCCMLKLTYYVCHIHDI